MAAKPAVEATKLSPAGWQRGGLRPANAQILRYGSGADVALAILDDHPQGHADWNTAKLQGPELTPGDKMTLEWEEIYSIGIGGLREGGLHESSGRTLSVSHGGFGPDGGSDRAQQFPAW